MLINIPLGSARINSEAAFVFPQSLCCNCGTTSGIATRQQNTKVTRYFMLAGTELTFELPLPVCVGCAKTLKRRVPTLFHKVLVLCMVIAALFLLLIMALSGVAKASFIADHLFAVSVILGLLAVVVFYWLRRPSGQQTSFYQPVRIVGLDREFVSGAIRKIQFGFTNPVYLREFSKANTQALRAGFVSATRS
jgi:hypothetical protein